MTEPKVGGSVACSVKNKFKAHIFLHTHYNILYLKSYRQLCKAKKNIYLVSDNPTYPRFYPPTLKFFFAPGKLGHTSSWPIYFYQMSRKIRHRGLCFCTKKCLLDALSWNLNEMLWIIVHIWHVFVLCCNFNNRLKRLYCWTSPFIEASLSYRLCLLYCVLF